LDCEKEYDWKKGVCIALHCMAWQVGERKHKGKRIVE